MIYLILINFSCRSREKKERWSYQRPGNILEVPGASSEQWQAWIKSLWCCQTSSPS